MTTQEDSADRLTELVRSHLGAKDRSEIKCPRETSSMTPCVARDGRTAVADDGVCVGCGHLPSRLVKGFEENHGHPE